MESSKLFKMLVVAVALQSSSNVFSMDLLGENGLQGLIAQYKAGSVEVAPKLLVEMGSREAAHQKKAVLLSLGINVADDSQIDGLFAKAQADVKASTGYLAKAKRAAVNGASFVKNHKKAIGATVAVATVVAAVYKREALKKAASDLASKVANSSYVQSAMQKGSNVKASVLATGSSVYASASGKLASLKAKLPSMPTMPKLSMPSFSMPKFSNPFAKSAVTATAAAVVAPVAPSVAQSATASN